MRVPLLPALTPSLLASDPIFSADGWITQTLESLPYFGFVVAVFRKQSGVEVRFFVVV
jgi:hypothetical protein